jgi:hypothetical protein
VTVNNKEENSEDFWHNYVQEFGLRWVALISLVVWLHEFTFLRKNIAIAWYLNTVLQAEMDVDMTVQNQIVFFTLNKEE